MNLTAIDAYLNTHPSLSIALTIMLIFLAAALISALSRRIINRLFSLNRFAPKERRLSPERQKTLQALISNGITALAFLIALMASLLAAGVNANTVVWVAGLFATAFGLAAQTLISDILSGITFLLNDAFDIGEKVELLIPEWNVQGVVESIGLLSSEVRASTGELYSVPNGKIRLVRNFSRGKFSTVNIVLCVSPDDLSRALDVLKELGEELYTSNEGLLEPWQVMSTSGLGGGKVELTVLARVVIDQAAEIKLELSNAIYDRFKREAIPIQ